MSSGNSASVTFQNTNVAAYVGQTDTIGDIKGGLSKKYEFTDNAGISSGTILANGNIAVNIAGLTEKDNTAAAPVAVMNELYNTMLAYYQKTSGVEDLSNYIQVNGATMVSSQNFLEATTEKIDMNLSTLTFTSTNVADYENKSIEINGTTYTFARGVSDSKTLDLNNLIATQTLTFANVPQNGETVTIKGTTYTFVTGAAGTNQISLDTPTALADAEAAMTALANKAGLGASRTGATLTLSGNVIKTDVTGGTIAETVDPTGLMTALAKLAGVEEHQTGASLALSKYNAQAIPTAANNIGGANLTQTVQNDIDLVEFTETNGLGDALSVVGKDNGKQTDQPDTDGTLVVKNTFSYNNVENAQSGSLIPAVSFNADGTPKEINTGKISLEWANGASDMTGNYYESSQINLYIGDENTANGLTQLAGKFTTNYVTQDGAKYGNYTGVSVSKDGIVTAANSSAINDGAAALVVMSEEKAKELGVKPLATWVAGALAGVEPEVMGLGPIAATKKVMAKTGMTVADMDLVEANEAFAAQSIAVGEALGFDKDKLNVNGGAIALGHPVGASGARILVTLLYAMKHRGAHKGLATLCIGGGMGCATIVEMD